MSNLDAAVQSDRNAFEESAARGTAAQLKPRKLIIDESMIPGIQAIRERWNTVTDVDVASLQEFVGGDATPYQLWLEVQIARAEAEKNPRTKPTYVGAPAIYQLDLCCQQINAALGDFGCYLVGSALERPDWRDVDVRFIMDDHKFEQMFPLSGRHWEHEPRWLLLNISIASWLRIQTGLPIDFQIQPQTHANERHSKPRHPLGLIYQKERDDEPC